MTYQTPQSVLDVESNLARVRYHVEGSAPLPVQCKVLRKGLTDEHLYARFHEDPKARCVLVQTISEALIGSIKDRQMVI